MRKFLKSLVIDLFIIVLQFGGTGGRAYAVEELESANVADSVPRVSTDQITESDVLKNSQISYRADGGFSGIESYGVILSCINGQVSVMKSIFDPRLPADKAQFRDISTMDSEQYLLLWNALDRMALLKLADAPRPKMDILDEFTVEFNAKIKNNSHKFTVYGISRPEAARYFAVRKVIDDSVHMQAFWDQHTHASEAVVPTPKAPEKAN